MVLHLVVKFGRQILLQVLIRIDGGIVVNGGLVPYDHIQ